MVINEMIKGGSKPLDQDKGKEIPGDVTPWEYEIPGIPSTSAESADVRSSFTPWLIVWRNSHFDKIIMKNRQGYNLWKKKNGFSRPVHLQALITAFGFLLQEIYFCVSHILINKTKFEPVIAAVVIGLVVVILSVSIMLIDPGVKNVYNVPRNISFLKDQNPVIDAKSGLCRICNFVTDERTHHCKYCNKCIEGFDHHCVYLSHCIGRQNYKIFISLIIVLVALLVFFIYFEIKDLKDYVSFRKILERDQIAAVVGISLCIAVLVVILGYVVYLIIFHIKLTYYGQTTLTYLKAKRMPKNNGL